MYLHRPQISILGRKYTTDSLVFTRNVSDIFWLYFGVFYLAKNNFQQTFREHFRNLSSAFPVCNRIFLSCVFGLTRVILRSTQPGCCAATASCVLYKMRAGLLKLLVTLTSIDLISAGLAHWAARFCF